ncbi:transient receptor potential cation channel subfamily A member 1 [Nematostella vectensis]|nr:transient receptor potential cation channel subfamily A member 1 [Nematostella vectensis]
MAVNGKYTAINEAREHLIRASETEGSPLIRIRNPALRKRSSKRPEYVRMRTFGSSADKCGPHQAAREGMLDVLKDFSDSLDSLVDKDVEGFEPIHHAVMADQAEAVELLLNAGVCVGSPGGEDELSPLHIAVRYNSLKAAKALMHHGADPSVQCNNGTTPLHLVARHGSQSLAELLLSDPRASVNTVCHGGLSPFHLACVSGNAQMCELFLAHEADIWLKSAEGRSPLHLAAASGHHQVVDMIMKYAIPQTKRLGELINSQDSEEITPLHVACLAGHVTTVEVCLKHGAELDARHAWGLNTALHVASIAGHVEVAKLLVSRGADVTLRNAAQRVPLHLAAHLGHCDVIKFLLENGSPIDPRDETSSTPLLLATRSGRTEAASLLLESGADVGIRTEALKSCLHVAVQNKHLDTARMLCDKCDADLINAGDRDLRVPLHHAASNAQLEMIKLLLAHGAHLGPRDVFGRTPLHMAAEHGNESCFSTLINDAPADINVADDSGSTPLHLAAAKGHRKLCKFLVGAGADVSTKDSSRWTPLHHAAGAGHVRTVETLMRATNIGFSYSLEAEDWRGNTPLMTAAGRGRDRVVQVLIQHKADVTARNAKGMTALDIAIENANATVVMEILKSESWFDILRPRPSDDVIPMQKIIETMPEVAEHVMDRCITCSSLPRHHHDYAVKFDLRLLDTSLEEEQDINNKGSPPRFFAPSVMVAANSEKLLTHDLTQALIRLKLNSLGRPLYWFNFSTFAVYLIMFTLFVINTRTGQSLFPPGSNKTDEEDAKLFDRPRQNNYNLVFPYIVLLFVSLHVIKEIYQMYLLRWSYFTSVTNYLEWAGYLTSYMFIFPFVYGGNVYKGTGFLWPLGSTAMLLCFTNAILFLRRVHVFGLYISMYIEVLKSLIKVLMVFILFILAFALAFYCLLKEQDAFKSFKWSFLKTFMMMVNGMDYQTTIVDSLGEHNPVSGAPLVPVPSFTVFIMVLFVILIVILLVNLLIGLAVGDIDAIRQTANLRQLAMEVEYVANLDERLPKRFLKALQKPTLEIRPNQKYDWITAIRAYGIELKSPPEPSPHMSAGDPLKDDATMVLKQQRMRIKELQSTINQQTVLLNSICDQLQKLTGVPNMPLHRKVLDSSGSVESDENSGETVFPPNEKGSTT